MKVLLVSQNFFPENFKSNDIAFELTKRGYEVDVLTGIPNYPEGVYSEGYGIFKKRIETVNNVKIYRSFQISRGKNNNIFRLSLNYLSFAFCGSIWSIYLAIFKKYDCIIVHQTSPITQVLPAIVVKKIQGIKLYTWVLDIWPDSVILGGGVNNKYALSLIDNIVKFVYNKSDKILISSKQFAELINLKGQFAEKLVYFPNWCDDMLQMRRIEIPQLPGGFIIMMAGNIGTAQTVDSVLNAALEMKNYKDVKWVFVGDGSKKSFVDDFIVKHELSDTVLTMGRFPFSAMPSFFYRADAMLLTLKADYPHLKAVVPARLQSYMSAAKPVLAMVEGGCEEVINESNCGFAVGADDYLALVDTILNKVLNDRTGFELLGMNGRKYFDENFTIDHCIQRLTNILNNL